jgi:hypothetical protein
MNFTSDDLMISLSYNDEDTPESEHDAKIHMARFINRLKQECEKLGITPPDVKYLYTTYFSTIDGVHHHCVISKVLDAETIQKCWPVGFCYVDEIDTNKHGYANVARYIARDVSPVRYSSNCAVSERQKAERAGKAARIEAPVYMRVTVFPVKRTQRGKR